MDLIVKTHDGLVLKGREWPATTLRLGTVLLLHGLGEHLGRHEHVAANLAAQGWRVCGYNQRGHGPSEGGRGQLIRDDDLLRDLSKVIDAVRAKNGESGGGTNGNGSKGEPFVLLGHSMGALIAARFVAEGLHVLPAPWYRPV